MSFSPLHPQVFARSAPAICRRQWPVISQLSPLHLQVFARSAPAICRRQWPVTPALAASALSGGRLAASAAVRRTPAPARRYQEFNICLIFLCLVRSVSYKVVRLVRLLAGRRPRIFSGYFFSKNGNNLTHNIYLMCQLYLSLVVLELVLHQCSFKVFVGIRALYLFYIRIWCDCR